MDRDIAGKTSYVAPCISKMMSMEMFSRARAANGE